MDISSNNINDEDLEDLPEKVLYFLKHIFIESIKFI